MVDRQEELRLLILGAQREGARVVAGLLDHLGLTPAQAEVLRCLADAGPLSLTDLGARLVCETGSPSRLVSGLVDKGLVDRREAARDRRRVTLSLTAAGAAAERSARAAEAQLNAWIAQRLTPDGVDAATRALHRLIAGTPSAHALAARRASE